MTKKYKPIKALNIHIINLAPKTIYVFLIQITWAVATFENSFFSNKLYNNKTYTWN